MKIVEYLKSLRNLYKILVRFEGNRGRFKLINFILDELNPWNKKDSINNKNRDRPKKILINYSAGLYKFSQKFNSKTGLRIANFDQVISYSPNDIDNNFYLKNKDILDAKKGAGYWLWKPYFVLKTLKEKAKFGDLIFYCDSGVYFINKIDHLIKVMNRQDTDVLSFIQMDLIEKNWTKRDCFILMNADEKEFYETPQRSGGYQLIRKSKFSLQYYNEYLNYAQNPHILTDSSNVSGKPNYDGFQNHRHDQSIFSILAKKYKLVEVRDPSQFGNKNRLQGGKDNDNFPQILITHRTPL